MPYQPEDLIDLGILYSSSYYEDEKLVLFYQEISVRDNVWEVTLFLLRQQLRKMGFRIEKIEQYESVCEPPVVKMDYRVYTNIPRHVGEEIHEHYNAFVSDIYEEI